MPYTPDHKHKTRQRIVRAASNMFRRDGYQATSVEALMGEAGLTRGGFYAHFENKHHLLEHAIDDAFDESMRNLFANGLEDLEGAAWLEAAEARYLRDKHLEDTANGCAAPSLACEVARAPESVRRHFEAGIESVAQQMAGRCASGDDQARREALARLARWVGAMVLARAVASDELRHELLEAAREG